MKLFTTSLFGAAAVALTMGAGSAHAALITGTNLDFEAPVGLTPNSNASEQAPSGTTAVPAWIINNVGGFNVVGVWAPAAPSAFFNAPPAWQANQVGFLDPGSKHQPEPQRHLYR